MRTTEYKLTDFNGINLDKVAMLGAEHFTKPAEMSKEDFIQKIKQELQEGYIDISIKETIFRRRLA